MTIRTPNVPDFILEALEASNKDRLYRSELREVVHYVPINNGTTPEELVAFGVAGDGNTCETFRWNKGKISVSELGYRNPAIALMMALKP